MITRFDRHLLTEWSKTFVFSLLMISIILMAATQLITWIATVNEYSLSFQPAMLLLLFQFPSIVLYAIPMSSLCASLVSMSQLNQQLAIVSVRAMGLSIPRIIQPIVWISFFLSMLSIGANEYGVAPSNQAAARITQPLSRSATVSAIHYQSFKSNGHLSYSLHAMPTPNEPYTLSTPTLIEYTNDNNDSRIYRVTKAASAHWRGGYWALNQGIQFVIQPSHIHTSAITTGWRTPLTVPPDRILATESRAEQLSSQALKTQIQQKEATGRFSRDDQFNLHVKFSLPFTTLTFAIIGALMSLSFQRTRSMANLGVGVGTIIAYYVLLSVAMGGCLLGWLYPVIAAWIPNLLLLGISFIWYQVKVRA
ncbi:hypothetical protein CL648_03525 [bacterium]|nr:hypothetical protein [bacterium]